MKYIESVSIGFDIGVGSVGYAVINSKTKQILESGVSIFPAAVAQNNVERREFRQSRRLIRRRVNRLNDLKKLLKKNGFIPSPNKNPYEIRVRGLEHKLNKDEIAIAMLHIAKRRGISYSLDDVVDENVTDFKGKIAKNQEALKNKTPGEIQYERLVKYGKVRGTVTNYVEYDEQPEYFLNVFPNSAYVDEAKRILTCQKQYYPEITDDLIENIVKIISRKRAYYIGPGNEKSRTDYGIYRTNGETLENIFEILIGKDSVNPDELRAPANSLTAQVYNLLNDLTNIRYNGSERLTPEQKQDILSELLTTEKTVQMLNVIAKKVNVKKEEISGFRTKKDNKPDFHTLEVYRKVRKHMLNKGIDINEWPTECFDELAFIFNLNTEIGEIRNRISEKVVPKYDFITNQIVDDLLEDPKIFAISTSQKWHRFSIKTMNVLIPELLNGYDEQMTILTRMGLLEDSKNDYSNIDKIDIKNVTENIYNPVVRKSIKKCLKIFNELYKKYPNISDVVIELPREDNPEDARKLIEKMQKENLVEKDTSLEAFRKEANLSENGLIDFLRKGKNRALKIRLWYQQEGKCLYTGEPILAEDLCKNEANYDIDHIIPISVSFDDSINNKVLCSSHFNRFEKEKKTPFEYFSNKSSHLGRYSNFDEFRASVNANKRISDVKRKNLLSKELLSDLDTRKKFIARNLVDTRYASRVVFNELTQFFASKKVDTKVAVIRGKFTSQLRRAWQLNKSRDTYHHHAVDAALIGVTPFLEVWRSGKTIYPRKMTEAQTDFELNAITTNDDFKESYYQLPCPQFLDYLTQMQENLKINFEVDKKMNRKISDATIYSTRQQKLGKDKKEEDYSLGTIKDIYTVDGYSTFKKIYDKDKEKFLMYHLDHKSFEILEEIVSKFPDKEEYTDAKGKVKQRAVSPFELYRRKYGYVQKYSKKNNGPIIRKLKYYDQKLGASFVDITPTDAKDKKVFLGSINPWRTDVYYLESENTYHIMGIKYADLRFINGKYGIPSDVYQQIKKREKIPVDAEFRFSLYKNDRIKVIDTVTNEEIELRFWSRTMPNVLGYVELKPIFQDKFRSEQILQIYGKVAKSGQFIKRLSKNSQVIYKVNTDELGNPYYILKESQNPKNIIDNSNKTE